MGNLLSNNQFPVKDRTIIITGGSRGMGFSAALQLAAKGASVIIVARGQERLHEAIELIQKRALNAETQRFHQISADLSLPHECIRVIDETVVWNGGPPDIVWCCAGSSYPTLFIDTPVSQFGTQMDNNYFTSVYMAHAVLTCWLKTCRESSRTGKSPGQARHLIFTASFLALCGITGYSPYSPAKAALRSLSDSLSQEMNLYATAYPDLPRIQVHTAFPATIYTESYEAENLIKSDITKLIESSDKGQTPDMVAAKCIEKLQRGQELITTDILTGCVKRTMLGGSVRGGFWPGMADWVMSVPLGLVMVCVRDNMDRKVRSWGRKYGASGKKESGNCS